MQEKILLYSPGLGYINRGLETFTRELYLNLYNLPNIRVTLFQGQGEPLPGGFQTWAPKRNSHLYKIPVIQGLQRYSYRIENSIFSLPVIRYCYLHSNTIVHFSESIPGNYLYRLRKLFGGSFKLLFSNGGPANPELYMRYDFLHVLTPMQQLEALNAGFPEHRLFLVPYGLNTKQFTQCLTKPQIEQERVRFNLPLDRYIIISIGAINMHHKRMDWLIQEFSKLDPNKYFLWIIGQPETEAESVFSLANASLRSDSYRFEIISYNHISIAYAISDCFALCSLSEGFGRVYLESMCSGLPTIAHRTMNTEWILGADNPGLINMTKPGDLMDTILKFSLQESISLDISKRNVSIILKCFDWQSLLPQYLNMYHHVSQANFIMNAFKA